MLSAKCSVRSTQYWVLNAVLSTEELYGVLSTELGAALSFLGFLYVFLTPDIWKILKIYGNITMDIWKIERAIEYIHFARRTFF